MIEFNCCDHPDLVRDQPAPDDDQQMVSVRCGNCGHNYGVMPLVEFEASRVSPK